MDDQFRGPRITSLNALDLLAFEWYFLFSARFSFSILFS